MPLNREYVVISCSLLSHLLNHFLFNRKLCDTCKKWITPQKWRSHARTHQKVAIINGRPMQRQGNRWECELCTSSYTSPGLAIHYSKTHCTLPSLTNSVEMDIDQMNQSPGSEVIGSTSGTYNIWRHNPGVNSRDLGSLGAKVKRVKKNDGD